MQVADKVELRIPSLRLRISGCSSAWLYPYGVHQPSLQMIPCTYGFISPRIRNRSLSSSSTRSGGRIIMSFRQRHREKFQWTQGPFAPIGGRSADGPDPTPSPGRMLPADLTLLPYGAATTEQKATAKSSPLAPASMNSTRKRVRRPVMARWPAVAAARQRSPLWIANRLCDMSR